MRKLFLIAAIAGLMASPASATTIYSNFGPGGSYNGLGAYFVGGSSTSVSQTEAVKFLSPINASVNQIDLAIGYFFGTNGLAVSLWTEAAGSPGSMLGSWTATGLPAFGVTQAPTSITGISGVSLSSGASYFLVVGPLNPAEDSGGFWNMNDVGATGHEGDNLGFGWDIRSGSVDPAFDILASAGSVPEPATIALMIGGIASAMRLRRRSTAK